MDAPEVVGTCGNVGDPEARAGGRAYCGVSIGQNRTADGITLG